MTAVHVHVVDPPAYTPPYDRALSGALARQGAEVTLVTAPFAFGPVTPADGYEVDERFGRHLPGSSGSPLRAAARAITDPLEMAGYRRAAREADVVHFQWLALPAIDSRLLPDRPLVITAHDVIPREPHPGQVAGLRRALGRADAVVVHSQDGRRRLQSGLGIDPERIHVIEHGAFTHLRELPAPAPLPPELEGVEGPVALLFGLMRPYKGIEVAIEAWKGIDDAELWVVGMPRMDIEHIRAAAPSNVRFVDRFVDDAEIPALFQRADLALLPYLEIDQSGVCFTAMAFGTPMVLSAVGGFPEIAKAGAAELVEPGDVLGLRATVRSLLDDPDARARLASEASRLTRERFDWDRIAALHMELYEELLDGPAAGAR